MPGIQFTETMRGYLSPQVSDDVRKEEGGDREGETPFEFTLTVASDNLAELLHGAQHEARMHGSVRAPALSDQPLLVEDGLFNLFVDDPGQPDTRRMRYRMQMTTREGRVYYFDGFKAIRNDPGVDVWADTTTLYITVYDGGDAEAPVLGSGVLKISPADFMKQLTTMKVTGAGSAIERLKGLAAFGRMFGGVLFDTYGGLFARQTIFDPDAPPRAERALRVEAPQVYFFETSDGVPLRLTRYEGGSKGPVMLVHGLGVSSRIFSTDTIETNLLEYLYERDYDVWLLDNRVSTELAAAEQFSTADDIATKDYPAAVARVRAETGAETIQAVVHCYGSTTFFMAMLAGLEGVRSAVASQIATHVKSKTLTNVKTGLHLPEVLDKLGIDSLTAYVDAESGWKEKLLDKALALYPYELEERCNSPVCHRITFLYGHLYEHDQLNKATHDALHELFGVANIGAFEHLGRLVREGHLVSMDGAEIYLPHLGRLAIPITFIHGAENACFVPESTEETYQALCSENGADLYERHVIPGYGHIDCIFGKNAAHDVFPYIAEHLERTGQPTHLTVS